MRSLIAFVPSLAFIVLWGACPAGAAPRGMVQPPPLPDAQGAEAALLVKQLDAPDVDARHAASVELRNMKGAVLPAVEEAAKAAGDAANAELKVVLPILRGRANMEARRKADHDRNETTALEAYDKVGQTYAKMPRYATADGKGTNDAAAATKGANVRTKGMKRPAISATPPYFS